MTNKMQLCRIMYCSLTALHVSRDIFDHNQEHLNCMYSFCYYSQVSLPVGIESEYDFLFSLEVGCCLFSYLIGCKLDLIIPVCACDYTNNMRLCF